MKGAPKVKTGDRVRVVLEGPAERYGLDDLLYVGTGGVANLIHANAEHVVSVEVLPPPVEMFGPGDTVRHKAYKQYVYTLAGDGAYAWRDKRFYPYAGRAYDPGADDYNSENYERVAVSFS